MSKLEKRGGGGATFLKSEHVETAIKARGKADFYIVGKPFEVDDNFNEGKKKPAIKGKLATGKAKTEWAEFQWSPNNTSWNYMIDTVGDNPDTWDGKSVELVLEPQLIEGVKRKVIYVKGAVKEE